MSQSYKTLPFAHTPVHLCAIVVGEKKARGKLAQYMEQSIILHWKELKWIGPLFIFPPMRKFKLA